MERETYLLQLESLRQRKIALARELLEKDDELEKRFRVLPPQAITLRSGLLRPSIHEALTAIEDNPENPPDIIMQNFSFKIVRLTSDRAFPTDITDRYDNKATIFKNEANNMHTYCALPTGKYATCDQGWSRKMAKAYHEGYLRYSYIAGKQLLPVTLTVITPEGFYKSGWVTNFGPSMVFLHPEGRKFLLGRELGHTLHEGWHNAISNYQTVYKKVIEPNTYLDESLAILATLMDGERYFTDSNGRSGSSEFEQLLDGLPRGNETSYTQQLLIDLVDKMPSFDALSAGQIFNEEVYCKRMLLSMFYYTLLQAKIGTDIASSKPTSEKIATGIVSLIATPKDRFNWDQDTKTRIQRHIFTTLASNNKPTVTEDALLKDLFGFEKKELERKFQKFGLSNYLLHRISFAFDPFRNVWQNLDNELTDRFPWIGQIAEELTQGGKLTASDTEARKKFTNYITNNLER